MERDKVKKTDRRVDKTKKSIHNAFVALIQRKPYTSITISELAREANIDRRTFYRHYEYIDDVASEMQEIARNMIVKKMEAHGEYQIDTFIDCISDVVGSKINFYRAIFTEPSCSRFLDDAVYSMKYCLLQANKNSSLDETRKEYYAQYIASGIMGLYSYWLKQDNPKMDLAALTALAKSAMVDSCKMIH